MSTFGYKLKSLRLEKMLTQDELAKIINDKYDRTISKSMISKWENNKEEPQRFTDVSALADFFGVKSDYLVGLTDDKYGEDDRYMEVPIRVKGDSMINARIFDGDIVFIRRQPDVENGEIAAVQIDGNDATLKRVYKINGNVILRPENPIYSDMVFSKKDMKAVQILGKAVFFKSEVR